MADPTIRLTYEGGDADQHVIDMRLLGMSLQGADRIISDGLILLLLQRSPKRGERAPLIVKAREPVKGSVDIGSALAAAAWTLPFAYPIAQDLAGEFLKQWWEAVKAKYSGKPEAAEKALETMLELNRDHLTARDASEARHLAARDESEARHHELSLAYLDLLKANLSQQQRPLEQFASPIGPSVMSARVQSGASAPTRIDVDDADQIRAMGELTWEPLREETLRTDGFKFHTSGLSIENPTKDGYLMAKVQDPRFEQQENVYTEASQRRSQIIVLARRGYKNGVLVRMDIVDFVREIAA